jgi:hypothetical protein
MRFHNVCLSVGIFLEFVLAPMAATDCSHTVRMCDVASAKPGCPACYSCLCTPIEDPALKRKSIYSKYLPRIRGDLVNVTKSEPEVTPRPNHKEDIANFRYEDFLRAVAKERHRGSRRKRTADDEECSFSFQKCHPNITKEGCSKCHNCTCRAIREAAVNETSADEDPFVAFILPKRKQIIPQEIDNRVVGLEFPRTRDLEDFKVFAKLLLESGHASAVPMLKMMKHLVKSDVDHSNYENPNYYRPFPETNDGIIRTKDHVYNLAGVQSEDQKGDDNPWPTTVAPRGRYQLYDRGFRMIRPVLDLVDRRNKVHNLVGDGRQLMDEVEDVPPRRKDGVGVKRSRVRHRKGESKRARIENEQ